MFDKQILPGQDRSTSADNVNFHNAHKLVLKGDSLRKKHKKSNKAKAAHRRYAPRETAKPAVSLLLIPIAAPHRNTIPNSPADQ